MLETISNLANSVIEFMRSEVLVIDGFTFSLWEILIVSTGGVILGKVIGSMLNISE